MGNVEAASAGLDQLDASTYQQLVTSSSSLGAIQASSMKPCWGIEGSAQIMKGHKHQVGGSIGFGLLNVQADFVQEASTLMYRDVDNAGQSYNRLVNLSQSTIQANMTALTAPIHFHYALRMNKKLKLHASAGVVLSVKSSFKTDQQAEADFAARLKFGEAAGSAVQTVFSEDGSFDLAMDESSLTESQRTSLTGSDLDNYDLAFNKGLSGSSAFSGNPSALVSVRAGAGYMVNSSTEATVGVGLLTGSQTWSAQPIALASGASDNTNLGTSLPGSGEWTSLHLTVNAGVRFYLISLNKK
jgi:hypothetical protein